MTNLSVPKGLHSINQFLLSGLFYTKISFKSQLFKLPSLVRSFFDWNFCHISFSWRQAKNYACLSRNTFANDWNSSICSLNIHSFSSAQQKKNYHYPWLIVVIFGNQLIVMIVMFISQVNPINITLS
jgi:hypothetical protein